MLKHGEINPLNVMGLRRVEYCPPHFEKVFFNCRVQDKKITDWIYENFEGRFYFGNLYRALDNKAEIFKCAAFEEPAEVSIFLLSLDRINTYSTYF